MRTPTPMTAAAVTATASVTVVTFFTVFIGSR